MTGLTSIGVRNYYKKITKDLRKIGYVVKRPEFVVGGKIRNNTEACRKAYNVDQELIRQSDIVLMDLTLAVMPSVGCIYEICWANKLDKRLIVICPPYIEWCQHSFIRESADVIVQTYEQAIRLLGLYKGVEV